MRSLAQVAVFITSVWRRGPDGRRARARVRLQVQGGVGVEAATELRNPRFVAARPRRDTLFGIITEEKKHGR